MPVGLLGLALAVLLGLIGAPPAAAGTAGPVRRSHTDVRIVVPPVTLILVDGHGKAIAVETNSGRAPRRGDLFLATASPGGVGEQPATDAQTNRALRLSRPAAPQPHGWHRGWHRLSHR